jgi:hypothetical protein
MRQTAFRMLATASSLALLVGAAASTATVTSTVTSTVNPANAFEPNAQPYANSSSGSGRKTVSNSGPYGGGEATADQGLYRAKATVNGSDFDPLLVEFVEDGQDYYYLFDIVNNGQAARSSVSTAATSDLLSVNETGSVKSRLTFLRGGSRNVQIDGDLFDTIFLEQPWEAYDTPYFPSRIVQDIRFEAAIWDTASSDLLTPLQSIVVESKFSEDFGVKIDYYSGDESFGSLQPYEYTYDQPWSNTSTIEFFKNGELVDSSFFDHSFYSSAGDQLTWTKDFTAGHTYRMTISVECKVTILGMIVYWKDSSATCDAGKSAYWDGIVETSNPDLVIQSQSGFDYRYAHPESTSPNAIRAPAVPEPATWAMLIAGFGLVGARLRRRSAGAGSARLA